MLIGLGCKLEHGCFVALCRIAGDYVHLAGPLPNAPRHDRPYAPCGEAPAHLFIVRRHAPTILLAALKRFASQQQKNFKEPCFQRYPFRCPLFDGFCGEWESNFADGSMVRPTVTGRICLRVATPSMLHLIEMVAGGAVRQARMEPPISEVGRPRFYRGCLLELIGFMVAFGLLRFFRVETLDANSNFTDIPTTMPQRLQARILLSGVCVLFDEQVPNWQVAWRLTRSATTRGTCECRGRDVLANKTCLKRTGRVCGFEHVFEPRCTHVRVLAHHRQQDESA